MSRREAATNLENKGNDPVNHFRVAIQYRPGRGDHRQGVSQVRAWRSDHLRFFVFLPKNRLAALVGLGLSHERQPEKVKKHETRGYENLGF